jgi:hypothetical protein
MRFRFTIRDLLWLTAVVALAVGWWLEHNRADRAEAKRIDALLKGEDRLHRASLRLYREAHIQLPDYPLTWEERKELESN